MRKLLRSRGGFSLVELIVSMLLSSFVMIGIVGIAAQMVRFQVEGMKKGSVTGWSLVALTAMNKEIEDGTTLVYPTNGTGAQDLLTICKNYTHVTNAALDSSRPIERISYCYDTTAPGYLRRTTSTGACPALGVSPGACNAGTYPEVIATGVYRDASNNNVFRRADEVGGVQIRYRATPRPPPTTPSRSPSPST
jgi:Tfp pilus assembly protein PilV